MTDAIDPSTLLLKALRRARAAGWTGTYTDDTKRGK